MIKCSKCGKKHKKTTHNCCWIDCKCGEQICGNCGSTSISRMDMPEDDEEARYWCCKRCDSCGMTGCAMCI